MSRLQKLLGVGKGYLERLPPVDVHKLLRIVLMNLPYIVIFYVGNNLVWLKSDVHKLIHATEEDTIAKYLDILKLDDKALKKVNSLRLSAENLEIVVKAN